MPKFFGEATTIGELELWAFFLPDTNAQPVGRQRFPDGSSLETFELSATDRAGDNVAYVRIGIRGAAGANDALAANADVVALQWLDSSHNPIAAITGFSIKYSAFLARANNSDLQQRYPFWVSLMNGNDQIVGGSSNDVLEVGAGGSATITSNEGNDHVYVWHQKDIVYNGGGGTDAIVFESQFRLLADPAISSGITVNLTTGTGTNPYGGTLKLSNVEDVTGTSLNDNITGDAADNTLGAFFVDELRRGAGGRDSIRGMGGDDTIGFVPNDGEQIALADGGPGGLDRLVVYLNRQAHGSQHVLDLDAPVNNTGVFSGASIANFEFYEIASSSTSTTFDFRGTDADETVSGSEGDDVLNGGVGNDVLTGLAGDDKLNGGSGNDTLDSSSSGGIFGGPGVDQLDGGGGGMDKAVINQSGSSSNLTFSIASPSVKQTLADGTTVINVEQLDYNGVRGRDVITGGAFADRLRANSGNDVLNGNDGDDQLYGDEGLDIINGGAGNDQLEGGEGLDTINGGTGDDELRGGFNEGADKIDGGTGVDSVVINLFGQTNALIVSLVNSAVQQSTGGGGTLVNVERFKYFFASNGNDRITGGALDDNVHGSFGNDIVSGNGGNDILWGWAHDDTLNGGTGDDHINGNYGNDRVNGGDGNDTLIDEDGNDVITGGRGNDTMEGGRGDDTYLVDSAGDQVKETTRAGTDTIKATVSYTLAANVENLTLIGIAINGTGNALANVLTGNASANSLDGAGGNDTINGSGGNDKLNGAAGNDVLDGGTGNDAMTGGTGNDTYNVNVAGDAVVEGVGQGTDTVNASINYALRANVENLTLIGTAGNATGNTLANVLTGNAAANRLIGLAGNDRLNGGDGKDAMTGGDGRDIFIFNTAPNAVSNIDRITDFNVADDRIELENGIFTALQTVPGTLPLSAFFTGAAAHDFNDHIIYNAATGALIYDSNGNLAGGAVQFATLAKNLALTNADFVVV